MESEAPRRKIEETIIEILKSADLETITEYNVRTIAAERLGIDFSNLDRKWIVRRVVESFLLSSPAEDKVQEETKEVVEEQPQTNLILDPREARDDGGRVICKLSDKRSISIFKFGEKNLVSIRDCYQKDGKQFHSAKGITLTARQWSAFRNNVPDVEEAITKMESRIRSEGVGTHIEAATPSSTASAPQEQIPFSRKQIEPETSNSQQNTPTPLSPQQLIPIEPTRLNGKNYYCWAHQMEFFLNQLKIVYVLTEPCPQVPQEARQWTNDDYICRRNILNSLSDQLFDQYSEKSYNTAKELWEELRFVYNEDYGAKRSHVHHYIHFQMVDGISVLEQVQLLNNAADSVIASGMWFDENFHVSAIVSKLPPLWKDFRAKLMREEFLPFHKLMHYLRLEEEYRNRCKKEGPTTKDARVADPNFESRVGHSTQGNSRKFDSRGKVNGRQKSMVPVTTELGIIDGTLKIVGSMVG